MKTSELNGAALDWAVAKCEYPEPDYEPSWWVEYVTPGCSDDGWVFQPSTRWAQGGPIIEREEITIQQSPERDCWMAHNNGPAYEGPTPLIAAMRCYVASKLGDEVEVPEELK